MKEKISLILGIIIAISILGIISLQPLYAQSTLQSFGGRITTARIPSVQCTGGYGPFNHIPAGAGIAGPFANIPGAPNLGIIREGIQILGLYNTVLSPICLNYSTGIPTPFFVFPVVYYGVSQQ